VKALFRVRRNGGVLLADGLPQLIDVEPLDRFRHPGNVVCQALHLTSSEQFRFNRDIVAHAAACSAVRVPLF